MIGSQANQLGATQSEVSRGKQVDGAIAQSGGWQPFRHSSESETLPQGSPEEQLWVPQDMSEYALRLMLLTKSKCFHLHT